MDCYLFYPLDFLEVSTIFMGSSILVTDGYIDPPSTSCLLLP